MKTSFILLILLLPALLQGQIINHFENSDSKWHVAKSEPGGNMQNPGFIATRTTVFGFQGDTTIDGNLWLKLHATRDSLFQTDLQFVGLLRSENSQVFFIDTMNMERLLYDFNLVVGDTVFFRFGSWWQEWIPVIEVDTFQLNGQNLRRLRFAEPSVSAFDWMDEVWIEGMGSIHTPLFPAYAEKYSEEYPDSKFVICSFSADQYVWKNSPTEDCYINHVLSLDESQLIDFEVFPNPFSDILQFKSNQLESISFTVHTSFGQMVKKIQITPANQSIDLSELDAGIYFLRISDFNHSKIVRVVKL